MEVAAALEASACVAQHRQRTVAEDKEGKMISIGAAEVIFILLLAAVCIIGVRIFRRRH